MSVLLRALKDEKVNAIVVAYVTEERKLENGELLPKLKKGCPSLENQLEKAMGSKRGNPIEKIEKTSARIDSQEKKCRELAEQIDFWINENPAEAAKRVKQIQDLLEHLADILLICDDARKSLSIMGTFYLRLAEEAIEIGEKLGIDPLKEMPNENFRNMLLKKVCPKKELAVKRAEDVLNLTITIWQLDKRMDEYVREIAGIVLPGNVKSAKEMKPHPSNEEISLYMAVCIYNIQETIERIYRETPKS